MSKTIDPNLIYNKDVPQRIIVVGAIVTVGHYMTKLVAAQKRRADAVFVVGTSLCVMPQGYWKSISALGG